jgi:predicted alpha-1,2-mannosidase
MNPIRALPDRVFFNEIRTIVYIKGGENGEEYSMRNRNLFYVLAILLSCFCWQSLAVESAAGSVENGVTSREKRAVDWVNPFIDTVKSRWFYFSSAARPFGLVSLSPDTRAEGDWWNSGYLYDDERIQCFSHIHAWQMAGLPVMPVTSDTDLNDYSSLFSHDGEIARPGYHKVYLKSHEILAELTSTTRVGFHRYTYKAGDDARLVVDLSRQLQQSKMSEWTLTANEERTELAGSVLVGATHRRPKPFRLYFLLSFSAPFTQLDSGTDGRYLLDFGQLLEAPLLMKAALSYTGEEGARRNLEAELSHWDFDRVRTESDDDWNEWLSRIVVEGGTADQTTKFYTDVWHALLGRRIVSDVDGRYIDNTGAAPVVRQGRLPHHNFDSLWGAHWSINILWSLGWPEVMDQFCETMVNIYKNGGLIPRGPSGGNYTFVMVGDPASSFFAAAYAKGIRNWDVEAAYEGLRKNAFPGGIRAHAGYEHDRKNASGGGITWYTERGYVPEDIPGKGGHRQGAAQTLEYAYQDWCLAQFAQALGRTEDAELFLIRSGNYRNLWNAETMLMRPRRIDGSWYEPFGPIGEGFAAKGFVESNSAVYTYFVPHDLDGLAALFGGPDVAIRQLEDNFRKAEPRRFITDHGVHAVAWIDYENQPSTQKAHLFSHFGQPWKTQYWVRKVHQVVFSDVTPYGGYNGDEDQGMMGSLSALMAIGLFSMDGGAAIEPTYEITTPLFAKTTIKLDPRYYPGKSFTIIAHNQSPENSYIQSAKLNGKAWNSFRFPHKAFAEGGTLELVLGPEPNRSWGLEK